VREALDGSKYHGLHISKRCCTDNSVMVASLTYYKYKAGLFVDLSLELKSNGLENQNSKIKMQNYKPNIKKYNEYDI